MTGERLFRLWGAPDNRKSFALKVAGMLVAGFTLGTITPYDSAGLPVPLRYAYWVFSVLLGLAVARPIAGWVIPRLIEKGSSALSIFMLFCAAISAPIFVYVIAADVAVYFGAQHPNSLTWGSLVHFLGDVPVQYFGSILFGYAFWYFQVFVIVVLVFGGLGLALERYAMPDDAPAAFQPEAGHLFLRRLPDAIGKKLVCLSMEDHYVRARTEKGDTLLFMRMSDAVDELKGYPGAQVHRSWWVAFDAIDRVVRDSRRHVVKLSGGETVPVSKTYLENLAPFLPEQERV